MTDQEIVERLTKFRNQLIDMQRSILAVPLALEEIRTMDAAITRLSERPTWQPIESAPKDWSSVLLADEDGNVCEGYYSHADGGDDCWYRANTCRLDDDSVLTPVYWMPLPEAPAEIAIRLFPLLLGGQGGIRLGAALVAEQDAEIARLRAALAAREPER